MAFDNSEEKSTLSGTNEKPMTESEQPWLKALNELLEKIDPKDAEEAFRNFENFVEGDGTWAEMQGIPQEMLFDMAERGYLKFKSGRLKEAEDIFLALSRYDHKTGYYHTALGAIYQKQKKIIEALVEYTVAIELNPEDITAYANRGEVYYSIAQHEQCLKDFEAAIALDKTGKDPWANRARFLMKMAKEEMETLEK